MSVSRVRYIKKSYPVNSSSLDKSTGILTVTANSHQLFTGINVTVSSGSSYDAVTATATITGANTFQLNCPKYIQNIDGYFINGYISSDSGAQSPQTLPRATGTDTIIQSYVNGSGGASYKVDLSMDGSNWITANTISHGTNSGNTTFMTISPGWAYMRANVISVGANTNLVIMTGE